MEVQGEELPLVAEGVDPGAAQGLDGPDFRVLAELKEGEAVDVEEVDAGEEEERQPRPTMASCSRSAPTQRPAKAKPSPKMAYSARWSRQTARL